MLKTLDKIKPFDKQEFSSLLSKCHNIIRDNDKLSPETSFDEISKVLFIKILHERDEKMPFSLMRFEELKETDEQLEVESGETYYQKLFNKTKNKYMGLFAKTDKITLTEESFLSIVKELEMYDLSNTSEDIKGIAFEKFLGKTLRGELGQYFTPRSIVDYMVRHLNPSEGDVVCDPCCGTGGFLIKAFEYVKDKLTQNIEVHFAAGIPNDQRDNLDNDLDISYKGGRMNKLTTDYFFGIDANPRMARTAKMNMIMHGDGHAGVYHGDGFENKERIREGNFDIILTNPPFGSQIKNKQKYSLTLLQYNSSTQVLFIERCLNLLKEGGKLGIVLPEAVLGSPDMKNVRKYVGNKARILHITCLPRDVFKSNKANVKTSILFLQKLGKDEAVPADYPFTVSKVESAGISTTGEECENELENVLQELDSDNSGISDSDYKFVKTVSYKDINSWSVETILAERGLPVIEGFLRVKLGDILTQVSNKIKLNPENIYKQPTIHLWGKGVSLRGESLGSKIKTKTQFEIKEGQLILSKIDARNGAVGIVPPELDGAVITGSFQCYDIDKSKVLPHYLKLILCSDEFMKLCNDYSTGTTGRKSVNAKNFLNFEISLPPIEKQNQYLNEINEANRLKKEAEQITRRAIGIVKSNLQLTFKYS